jgi:hypothetical protein
MEPQSLPIISRIGFASTQVVEIFCRQQLTRVWLVKLLVADTFIDSPFFFGDNVL